MLSAIRRLLGVVVLATWALTATAHAETLRQQYPEASPLAAFATAKEARIPISDPRFFAFMSGTLRRVTFTLYEGTDRGYLTTTYSVAGHPVTYYYNIELTLTPQTVIAADVLSYWGDAFLDLVPLAGAADADDVFPALPAAGKAVFVQPVGRAFVRQEQDGTHSLRLVKGNAALTGVLSFPAQAVAFEDQQEGRAVTVFALEIGEPYSVRWSQGEEKHEWNRGEPVRFVPAGKRL